MKKILLFLAILFSMATAFGQTIADKQVTKPIPQSGASRNNQSDHYSSITLDNRFFPPHFASNAAFLSAGGKDSTSLYFNDTIQALIIKKRGGGFDTLSTSATTNLLNYYTKAQTTALFALRTGTNATGTWPISINGNSNNTSFWGNLQSFASGTPLTTNLSYGLGTSSVDGYVYRFTPAAYGTWLGLGSNAYTSTPFVPQTRTLTGGWGVNSIGDLSSNRTISIDTTSNGVRTALNSYNKSQVDARDVVKPTYFADSTSLKSFVRAGVTLTQVNGYSYKWFSSGYVANGGTVFGATGGGYWVLQGSVVTPQVFGAIGNGTTDDIIALRKWGYFIAHNNTYNAQIDGKFRITAQWLLVGATNHVNTITANCEIIADYTSESEVVRFENFSNTAVTGSFLVTCGGSTTWSTRTNGTALRVYNSTKLTFDFVLVKYSKYDGMVIDGTSFASGVNVLSAEYCGPASSGSAVGKNVNLTAVVNTGGTNSTEQRSVITISEVPVGIVYPNTYVKIGSRLHQVMSIDAANSKISVYPWIDNTLVLPQSIGLYMGAGLRVTGGDASSVHIGTYSAFVCGIGILNQALYPASVDDFISQSNGVASIIGLDAASGNVGGYMGNAYFEANDFDFYVSTLFSSLGFRLNSSVALNLDKSGRIVPALTDNSLSRQYSRFDGIAFSVNGKTYEVSNDYETGFLPSSSVIGITPPTTYDIIADSRTLSLIGSTSVSYNRLFGGRTFTVTARGTGTNGNPTGSYTLTPETGYTINGGASGASFVISGMVQPTEIRGFLVGTAWTVYYKSMRNGTTIGESLLNQTNPSAITFPRYNADNTVSALSASAFRTAIGGDATYQPLENQRLSTTNDVIFNSLTTTRSLNGDAAVKSVNTSSGSAATGGFRTENNLGYYGGFFKTSSTYNYKIFGANDVVMYNSPSGGDIAYLNDNATGGHKWASGGASTPQMILSSTGAFSVTNTITSATRIISATGTNGGFENTTFATGHNNIWRFGASPEYGIGYYQGGTDYIGFHWGSRSAPKQRFYSDGTIQADGNVKMPSVQLTAITSGTLGTDSLLVKKSADNKVYKIPANYYSTSASSSISVMSIRAITSATTILATDYTVYATSGTFVQPLPTTTLSTGQVINISNIGVGTVTVTATSMNGQTSINLGSGDNLQLQFTGTSGTYIIL